MADKFKACSINGCKGNAHWTASGRRGRRSAHRMRWYRHGDPLGGGTSPGEPERYCHEVVLAYEGDECLPWPYAKDSNGYGQIWHDGRLQHVTRVICGRVHGPAPTPEHEAAHSCGKGNFACCTKGHLSWKTPAENQADRLCHGTHGRGEQSGTAKLTEIKVREIRALCGTQPQRSIASRFGISEALVSMIKTGKCWGWLNE